MDTSEAELASPQTQSLRNRFDRMEWAGAFGDLGTLIPFVLAYISVMKLDPLRPPCVRRLHDRVRVLVPNTIPCSTDESSRRCSHHASRTDSVDYPERSLQCRTRDRHYLAHTWAHRCNRLDCSPREPLSCGGYSSRAWPWVYA